MKNFKGKAIYNPSGKAGEYSYWACNFYVGCSNACEYCYCRKGILATNMGQDKPRLKKCFRDETHALEVFEKELKQNLAELQNHGLFFSFTTDPMLCEKGEYELWDYRQYAPLTSQYNTVALTWTASTIAVRNNVPIKILTKNTNWVDRLLSYPAMSDKHKSMYAFGFTLTGHDELEPNASTNKERINAMWALYSGGFKTWASIEPIVDFESSYFMIQSVVDCAKLLKVGLMSGKKYSSEDCRDFIEKIFRYFDHWEWDTKIYFKDGLLTQAGINREDLPGYCVTRDYNMFEV